MEQMRAIIAGMPYNTLPQNRLKLREQNYQTAVYLIFKLMGQFVLTTERRLLLLLQYSIITKSLLNTNIASIRHERHIKCAAFDKLEYKAVGNISAQPKLAFNEWIWRSIQNGHGCHIKECTSCAFFDSEFVRQIRYLRGNTDLLSVQRVYRSANSCPKIDTEVNFGTGCCGVSPQRG